MRVRAVNEISNLINVMNLRIFVFIVNIGFGLERMPNHFFSPLVL